MYRLARTVCCSLSSEILQVVGRLVEQIVVLLAHRPVLPVSMAPAPIVAESAARFGLERVLPAPPDTVGVSFHPQRLIPGCPGLPAVLLLRRL